MWSYLKIENKKFFLMQITGKVVWYVLYICGNMVLRKNGSSLTEKKITLCLEGFRCILAL